MKPCCPPPAAVLLLVCILPCLLYCWLMLEGGGLRAPPAPARGECRVAGEPWVAGLPGSCLMFTPGRASRPEEMTEPALTAAEEKAEVTVWEMMAWLLLLRPREVVRSKGDFCVFGEGGRR